MFNMMYTRLSLESKGNRNDKLYFNSLTGSGSSPTSQVGIQVQTRSIKADGLITSKEIQVSGTLKTKDTSATGTVRADGGLLIQPP